MMTMDEFEVKRNQLTEEIRQLEAEIRDRQSKIQTLVAARDIFNERTGRPREQVKVETTSKPRGAISDAIRVYIGSHEKYTTTEVVDYLMGRFPDEQRRSVFGTVYTYLKRHPDGKWQQQEEQRT